MSRDQHTPWGREGMNRSQWLLKYRGAKNQAIQALSHKDIRDAPPATILRHIRDESVAAPPEIFAVALQQSADFLETQDRPDREYIGRLRKAAELAMQEAREGEGEEDEAEETAKPEPEAQKPVSRAARLRHKLEAIAPLPEPATAADPYSGKPLEP